MPKPRKRLISLETTPYYHCLSRCVRRAYLCGNDPVSGYSLEHRRQWIVDRMQLLARVFAIDLCAYAVMTNHYHVVLRIDAARTRQWEDREVARRWLKLFSGPAWVRDWLEGAALSQGQRWMLEPLIACWRRRLADVSWFMRCLNEPIARLANREDQCTGRFWEGRFKSQALLDEKALLACMAYVDLNPIRARMAVAPEASDYTSIQARICQPKGHGLARFADESSDPQATALPYGSGDYLEMVDWAGRSMQRGKRGSIDRTLPPIVERLSLRQNALLEYLCRPGEEPMRALGTASQLRALARSLGMKCLHGMSWSKRLYAASA